MPWSLCSNLLSVPSPRGTHIQEETLEGPLITCIQSATKLFGPSMQKMSFLKMEGLYFRGAHLCTESLIYESTKCSENVPFLWIKLQLSANSANTLTSFCKHFHVIQSLTSFVSTRVKLLGKITLFPLKNHFLFKQPPVYSTPPTSSWSWLTFLGLVQWPEPTQFSVPGQVEARQIHSVQILIKITIA